MGDARRAFANNSCVEVKEIDRSDMWNDFVCECCLLVAGIMVVRSLRGHCVLTILCGDRVDVE